MNRMLVAGLVVAALLVGGCSSGPQEPSTTGPADRGAGADADQDVAGAPDTDGPDGPAAEAPTGVGAGDDSALTVGAAVGRELIRRAHLTLESADPARTVQEVRDVVEVLGGFVSATNLGRDEEQEVLSGSMTLRIPAERLDGAVERLTGLRSVTAVTDERLETEDVTGELTDLASELRNLRAVEAELRALLSEIRRTSGSAEEVLQLFSRIREVRSEIERLEGRRATLRDLVALATVHLEILPDHDATPPLSPDPWRPGRIVENALAATVSAFQSLATGLIWLGLTGLPVLAVTAGPVAGVVWWLRRRRQDRQPPAPAGA